MVGGVAAVAVQQRSRRPVSSQLVRSNLTRDGSVCPGRGHPRARGLGQSGALAIGLHECRHTYAAHMIAAGVNAKALSAYMGHSSITITLDRYGHLMPGSEREAAELLEDYLARGADRT